MAVYGQLHPFDQNEEDWTSYIERAKLCFTANKIEEEAQKRVIILTCCGPKTYQLIKRIVAPEDPNSLFIDQLETLVGSHYNPILPLLRDAYSIRECVNRANRLQYL